MTRYGDAGDTMTYISEIKGRSGKDHIESVMKVTGPLTDVHAVNEDILQAWTGTLPDILIDFWRNHGLGTLQKGMVRLCLPGDFDGLLSQIFHEDKDFSHKDCHVLSYSQFGHLTLWSERHWIGRVDLLTARVSATGLSDPSKKRNANASIVAYVLGQMPDSLEVFDDDDKKLFKRAVKKLGLPKAGEAFGFAPALAMGGTPNLANIKTVPALEHFLFLAQLQQFQLIDYLAKPIKTVRAIG